VTVNYTGTFADGTKFDSSLNPGRTPFTFTIGGQVIQGWNEGVVGMQVGGTRKLVIPPALGYGDQDHNGIPGGSTLYFTIDLLAIN
jgi:peptidylprolyl isomerase